MLLESNLPMPAESYPTHFRPEAAELRVYLLRKVKQHIEKHAAKSSPKECAGILFGHPFQTQDNIVFTIVSGALTVATPDAGHAHVSVDIEQLQVTIDKAKSKYPGQVPVGWYHSHPGWGIFLSGTSSEPDADMFVVNHVFPQKWQISIVADPISRGDNFGIFVSPHGKRLAGYYIVSQKPFQVDLASRYLQLKEQLELNNRELAQSSLVDMHAKARALQDEAPDDAGIIDWHNFSKACIRAYVSLSSTGTQSVDPDDIDRQVLANFLQSKKNETLSLNSLTEAEAALLQLVDQHQSRYWWVYTGLVIFALVSLLALLLR
jgi:proteasome lid subunit RPN8/RPN11